MPFVVYVPLLDQGADVWRPVDAVRVGRDLYQLLGLEPDDERWQFKPGAVVRCTEREFQDGSRWIVAVEERGG
jgi:hypothetical protein